MTQLVKRLLPALLAVALIFSLAPPPAEAVQNPSKAEGRLHSLINDARKARGRVRLPWDNRLADIAQYRSNDMAKKGYFAHPPSGAMREMLDAKGIVWYRWGETLAWNKEATALESANNTLRQWRNSQAHWDLLMSADFNYIAIGVARGSDGRYIWTALLLKGPDRTKPKTSMLSAQKGTASGGKRTVTVSWTGHDVKLSVLTAGLRDFRLQRRVGTGSWKAVTNWTTATSRKFELSVGKTYRFRVRARDKNGNRSTWSVALTVKP